MNPSNQKTTSPPATEPVSPSLAPVGPPAAAHHRRIGKIARLPVAERQLVNVMLRDGRSYAEIIAELATHGHTLNPDNLSRWHGGGYQEWLHEQTILEQMHTHLDFARDVIREKNAAYIQEASLRIAVFRMLTLLMDFQPETFKDKLAEEPGTYARILNSLCKLTRGSLEYERRRIGD